MSCREDDISVAPFVVFRTPLRHFNNRDHVETVIQQARNTKLYEVVEEEVPVGKVEQQVNHSRPLLRYLGVAVVLALGVYIAASRDPSDAV